MKSGFHDPITPKIKEERKKSTWDYRAPEYDERSSHYVDAGTHYGVGYNQPIGRNGNPKQFVASLPFGRVDAMKVSQIGKGITEQDYLP